MGTYFSRHGSKRLLERSSLTEKEVAQILDDGQTVDIGYEQGTNRMHRLFYSHKDRFCFLAVQDMQKGTVITIMPADNRGKVKHISVDALFMAEQLAR